MNQRLILLLAALGLVSGLALRSCRADVGVATAPEPTTLPFAITEIANFDEPWAMAFLPDGRLLVTEKAGHLKLLKPGGAIAEITGVPAVDYGGQGGLGDIVLHPKFAENGLVYLSFVEAGEKDTRGAAVARAHLLLEGDGGRLENLQVIWRQWPKVEGNGQYGHRIAFDADGKLWISSGERQKFDPAQDMSTNLGKILRLNDDGSVPADNPFAAQGGVSAQIWTLGHRNPLGLAFDGKGRPWVIEMGPQGGDELNLILRGRNYGWPKVSNGDNYDGSVIPDHDTAPQFEAPKISWTPVIAPAGLIFYSGAEFPDWQGNALAPGLRSEAIIRIAFDGDQAHEVARYAMEKRMRAIAQGPKGELWALEDGHGARLLKFSDPSARPQ
jgi:glucose/arabinose dehydrogenase